MDANLSGRKVRPRMFAVSPAAVKRDCNLFSSPSLWQMFLSILT